MNIKKRLSVVCKFIERLSSFEKVEVSFVSQKNLTKKMNEIIESSSKAQKKYEDAGRDCSILYLTEIGKHNEALSLIEQTQFDKSPEILLSTARCYVGIEKNHKALEILCHAEKKGWLLPEIISMKGRILFKLSEFEQARKTFELYEKIYTRNKNTSLWLLRCDAHISLENDPSQAKAITVSNQPSDIKIGQDWYQNQTNISLTLFISHLTKDQISVVFQEKSIDVTVKSKNYYHHVFNLLNEIIPSESKFVITEKKVEIKMTKAVPNVTWKTLEAKP